MSESSQASGFAALCAFVTDFAIESGDTASVITQSRCRTQGCGSTTFWMQVSEEEGVANRTCTACKQAAFIGDSDEHWATADIGDATCPCSKKIFELGIGYSLASDGEVLWMYVGAICVECSTPGVYADWSIDYEPSKGLLNQN
jgi:hypothetical protein